MSDSDSDSARTDWEWRLSFEVASYTLLLSVALSILLSLGLTVISNRFKLQILGTPIGTAILGASEALLLVTPLVYARRFGISRDQLGMQFENYSQFAWDVTVGIIVGIAMIPVSLFASALNEAIIGPQPQAGYIKGAYSAASPLELLMLLSSVMFVVAPVEEIIFRGFVQQGFEKSFGRGKGLTAASLFFALVHLSAWSIFPLTILGMMLGLCFRVRHNRVLAPIISHALYMVFLVFSVST